MKNHTKKLTAHTLQKSLHISSLAVLISAFISGACAQQNNEAMVQAHLTTGDTKPVAQKLRQYCMSKVADGVVSEDGAVKICTFNPGAKDLYQKLSSTRKLKLSKATAKDGTIQETVSLNVAVRFQEGADAPTLDQRAKIVSEMQSECLPNMQYFWSNKGDIYLDLKLNSTYDSSSVDQVLALDYAPIKVTPENPADAANFGDFEFQIESWGHGNINKFTTSDSACNKAEADDKISLPTQKDAARVKCHKNKNQNFCLALNKMVGHWMGIEDKTDINCYPTVADTSATNLTTPTSLNSKAEAQLTNSQTPNTQDPDTQTPGSLFPAANQTSVAAPKVLPSFMTYIVNPQLVPSNNKVTSSTEPKIKDAPATQAPTSQDQTLKNMSAEVDANIQGSLDSTNGLSQPAPLPQNDVHVVGNQSSDESYTEWLKYEVTKEDIAQVFKCNLPQAEKEAMKYQVARKAPPAATSPQNQNPSAKVNLGQPNPANQNQPTKL